MDGSGMQLSTEALAQQIPTAWSADISEAVVAPASPAGGCEELDSSD